MLDVLPERVNRYRLADRVILYCNTSWAAQYQVTPEAAIGRVLDDFLSDDELEGLHAQLAVLGPDNPILSDEIARAVPRARDQWLQWVDRYLMGPDGPEVLSVGRDVTAQRLTEIRLAQSEARFRELADRSSDVVWHIIAQPSPHFDYISPSVESILGYPAEHFIDDFGRALDLLDPDERAAIFRAIAGEQKLDRFDFRLRHRDGSIVIVETRSTAVPDGIQGVSRDVTQLRGLQEELAQLALRDSLTGLANRRLIEELLDAALIRSRAVNGTLAVTYVDLDGLKQVNDNYGHEAGDAVLRETADRLRATVGGTDLVARLGGDEFLIVHRVDGIDDGLPNRVAEALAAPIEVTRSVTVRCPASVGTADTRAVGWDASRLIDSADQAMYEMKRSRRGAGTGRRSERNTHSDRRRSPAGPPGRDKRQAS